MSTEPLDLVCMDYLSLEAAKGGYNSILVITDHFTKYSMAIPTRNQTAATTAKVLMNHFIYNLGIPRRLHSDQGGSFEAKVIRHLCDSHGILKSRTTPYHPEGDGITERFNRTLLGMLRTLDGPQKCDWKSHVSRLVHAYNCTKHSSTDISPYFLMFGRHPRLPIDSLFDTGMDKAKSPTQYAIELRNGLKEAFASAEKASREARQQSKTYYDKKVRGVAPQVGDLVLVKKLHFEGKHKLEDKFEPDVYSIIRKDNPDLPVYTVRKEDGKGRERTLHRNHLLPVVWPLDARLAPNKKQAQKVDSKQRDEPLVCGDVESDSNSDDSDAIIEVRRSNRVQNDVPLLPEDFELWTDEIQESIEGGSDDKVSQALDEDEATNETSSDALSEQVNMEAEGLTDSEKDEETDEEKEECTRPVRSHKPPKRFGDYVMYQQTVSSTWMSRADYLLSLVPLFPESSYKILESVLYVVAKASH